MPSETAGAQKVRGSVNRRAGPSSLLTVSLLRALRDAGGPFFCLSLPRYALYRSSGGSGRSQPSSPDGASSASSSTPAAAPSRASVSLSLFSLFFMRGVRSCVRKKKNCTNARVCVQYSSVSPALRIRGIPCVRGDEFATCITRHHCRPRPRCRRKTQDALQTAKLAIRAAAPWLAIREAGYENLFRLPLSSLPTRNPFETRIVRSGSRGTIRKHCFVRFAAVRLSVRFRAQCPFALLPQRW